MSSRSLSRRNFIELAGIGGLVWLSGCSTRTAVTIPAQPGNSVTTAAFKEPQVLASSDGQLEVTLTASQSDGRLSYNGQSPGPTLRLQPGDRLTITLENQLDAATNLHTHGLHVSPEGQSDNVFVAVAPSDSRTYIYDIPEEHSSGLFWYHPHLHGSVAAQVSAGLAGAIIIADEIDDIPELANTTERLLVLNDPPTAGARPGPMDQMAGRQGPVVLVNGVERPTIAAVDKNPERWRILNASTSRYYNLSLDDHTFQVIGSDGARLPRAQTADTVLLAPGERTELVVSPTTSGEFVLRSLAYDRGNAGMGAMLGGGGTTSSAAAIAELVVDQTAAAVEPLSMLPGVPSIAALKPTIDRTFDLGMGMGGPAMMAFTIDGRTFNADRTDVTVEAGAVERWTLHNSTSMDHPFHLHVWPFLIEGHESPLGWKDTVNVPAGETISIVVPFTGHTGRTVYHCHILDHEDTGMMGIVEVA